MPTIWLRNEALSTATGGDSINLAQNNPPFVSPGFGNPDLGNVAEVQAACKAWYPTKLRGETLNGYEITPVDDSDPQGRAGDIVFAPVGEFADSAGRRFPPSTRNRRRP